jgi:hypothetical protein
MSTYTSTFRAAVTILVFSLTVSLAMLAPVIAGAAPLQTCSSVTDWQPVPGPVRCTDDDLSQQVWDDPNDPWASCDGFYVVATYTVKRTITDWWTHALVHVSYSGVLSSSSDRSKAANYRGQFNKSIDYTTDPPTIRRSGIATHVAVPHGGLAFIDGGTEVFGGSKHGPVGDLAALCGALS